MVKRGNLVVFKHLLKKSRVSQTGELIFKVGKDGRCIPGLLSQITNTTLNITVKEGETVPY